MVELVKYIVDQLVDDKSAVNITTEENDGVETITINVAEGDIGKVIGKQGKIAMSIRTLARQWASRKAKGTTSKSPTDLLPQVCLLVAIFLHVVQAILFARQAS